MSKIKVEDSEYLTIYKDTLKEKIIRMHPEWDEDKVDKRISKMIEKRLKDPEVTLSNDYIKQEKKSTLLHTFDYILTQEPIIAGNATLFKQHAVSRNPNAEMVDGFLINRKKYKKQMFQIGDESSHIYQALDLLQQNTKKLANSYYGANGAKTSPFYSLWCASSTTASAQSVISTTETTYEAFLSDEFIFIDFNECISWIDACIKDVDTLDDWIVRVSKEDCYDRIANKVLGITEKQESTLRGYIKSMTEEEVTTLYWKNNLIAFTEAHEFVKDLHRNVYSHINDYEEIFDSENLSDIDKIPKKLLSEFEGKSDIAKAWNDRVSKEKFYDPNVAPDSIKKYLEALKDIYMRYVYVKFIHLDKIYRLKNFERAVVTVIDTDSNILSLDTWMNYYLDNVLEGDYGREENDNIFLAVNSITYIITEVVGDILLYYGECSNIEESIRPRYNMKNEFYFAKLIIAKTKKRYLSKILLREGNRLKKPKYDVKGFDFKKSTTSEEAEKVYMSIIREELLDPDDINLQRVLQRINDFKLKIRTSIEHGDITYLPIGNAKELEAYKDPSVSQSVRALLAWNICEPDKMLEFPSKVRILKMKINKEEDISELAKTEPAIYEAIMKNIFRDTSGIFIKKKKATKKNGDDDYKITGMTVLAIPMNQQIPKWAMPYIDYGTIINAILAPFKSVTEIFNIPGIEEGKTDRKTMGLSNIIRL